MSTVWKILFACEGWKERQEESVWREEERKRGREVERYREDLTDMRPKQVKHDIYNNTMI